MRRRGFLAGALAGAAAASGRARAQLYPPTQPFALQLTLGVNVTLSGDFGKFGSQVVRGVQAAVDETNRFSPPIGRVFGVRSFDDRNQGVLAATNVEVAAADPSIVAMIGGLTGPMTLAGLSRYANANFALVIPTVTADAVTARGYHNVYRLPAKDSDAGRLFASSALDAYKGVATIAVALDGDYGYDVARAFVAQAKADRHPADVLLFPKDKTDPADAAKTILDRAPGYVFLAGKTKELGPVVDALHLAGYTGAFGASDGFYNQATITSYATALAGALVASPMPPLTRIPSIIALLNDFEHEVGQITAFSAYGYAAAQLLISAVQRANATTRYTLLDTLQRGGAYETLVGDFSFNVNGDPVIPNIYLYKVGAKGFTYERPAIRTGFVV